MNKADFRHNYYNKLCQLLEQRKIIDKKIEAQMSIISFITMTELPDAPEGSIIERALNE